MSDTCVRWKVDIPQLLISTAAVFGVGVVCYKFNMKVFVTARDLMAAALFSENHKWVVVNPPADAEDSNIVAEDSNTVADTPQTNN